MIFLPTHPPPTPTVHTHMLSLTHFSLLSQPDVLITAYTPPTTQPFHPHNHHHPSHTKRAKPKGGWG